MRSANPYRMHEATADPVIPQGYVSAKANYDIGARVMVQNQNANIGASLYGGAENPEVWDALPREIAFVLSSEYDSANKVVSAMSALTTLNGLGAVASKRYANRPEAPEMVRQAVANQVVPMGTVFQMMDAQNPEKGFTVQIGGMVTVRMGNNEFGDDSERDHFIRPGDIVCADVPMPTREGRDIAVGSKRRAGIPSQKFTLQVRRCSTDSSGRSLLFHIQRALSDSNPAAWRESMGEHLTGTKAWQSAADTTMRSYLLGGLFVMRAAMASGLVMPTTRGAAIDVAPAASSSIAAALGVAQSAAIFSPAQRVLLEQGADSFIEHLAIAMQLIPDSVGLGDRVRGLNSATANDTRRAVVELRAQALNRIFSDGRNPYFEHGAVLVDRRIKSSARFPRVGGVNTGTPAGQLLLAQLNHMPRAVSAFHTAIMAELKKIIGKATTAGSVTGSGNVNVYLGICRP